MPCSHAEGVNLRRCQFDRAVTQRVGEQAALCEEWGGEGEESDPCMGVARVNETHLAHIFRKLDVHTRAELSAQAVERRTTAS